MAVNPTFMSYLQGGSSGGSGTSGQVSQVKKNPYAQTQQVRSTSSGPTPGNTPVTPTGTVNPNNPPKPQPSPNQMVTQAQTPPPTPDPFAAMGGGDYNPQTGGWTPKNMNAGQPAGTTPGQPATVPGLSTPGYMQHLSNVQAYAGTNLGQHQDISYDPTQVNAGALLPQQGYQAGNFGTDPYAQYNGNPGNIGQFNAPQNQAVQNQQQALLMNMLQNPLTMSDTNVQQLKAQQRATALAQQQAGQSQNAEQMAAMGRVGSGAQQVNDARLRDTANSNVLNSYRDIALKKMLQDRTDTTGAINTAGDVLDSQSQRATAEYAQQLAGQQAREKVGLDSATSAQAAGRLGLDRTTAQEDANYRQSQSAQDLSRLGLDVEKFNAGENWNAAQSAQTNQQQALTRAIAQASDAQGASDSGLKLGGMLQDSWNNQQNRDTQTNLAQQGFGIDRDKIAQTGQIAKMDNSTRLMDILLGDQRGRIGLNQSGQQIANQASQFGQTLGFNQQGQNNDLMKWLYGQL